MTSQWYSELWSIELNWNDQYWWRGHLAKNLLWIFGSKCESKGGSSYLGVKSGFHPQRPLSNPPTKTSHWIFHKKWLHAFFRDIGFLLISLPLSPSHLSNDRRHLDFFLIVRSDPTVCCWLSERNQNHHSDSFFNRSWFCGYFLQEVDHPAWMLLGELSLSLNWRREKSCVSRRPRLAD